MESQFTDVIKRVKPGKIGTVEVVHDTPSKMDRIRGSMHGQPLFQDKYCRLLINKATVMTDAEFERRTNIEAIIRATGNALVAGLGIGLVLDPMIKSCKSVTVIEKNEDVISLVGPSFPKAKVIHADIFEWEPQKGTKFDTIYFDIWTDICADDLDEAKQLHAKFRKYQAKGAHVQSWTRIANKYNRFL